jgi:carboxymethylenebutenolidase
MAHAGMLAETINIQGHNGDLIDAYLARPLGEGPHPGVVVIHHMPGWDRGSVEIARSFAAAGYAAICPNLHFREGKGDPRDNSISVREAGGMPDDRTLGDVQGAMEYLRYLPAFSGKIGVIGYCSGGRQTYLAACKLSGLDAAVDCYGGGVVASADQLSERMPVAPIDYTAELGCPLLGLFGNDDRRPSPVVVDKMEAELKRLGKTFEFHRYDDAGHAFFTVGSQAYRHAAARDGWKRVLDWFGQHLS